MIQDIMPHRYDNSYREQAPQDGDYAFVIRNDRALLISADEAEKEERDEAAAGETDKTVAGEAAGQALRLPDIKTVLAIFPDVREQALYLFSIDDRAYFLIDHPVCEAMDEETLMKTAEEKTGRRAAFMGTTYFRTMEPVYQAFAAVTALQLWRFRESRRFCGRCGSRTEHSKTERAYVCPVCGQIEYPKISPAVIVAITNGDKLLMSRYRGRPYGGYALIAGFVEIGETFEETVRREVMEEVGLQVKNIRYAGSQPWGFTDSEMIGFFAELDGDDTIRLEEDELAEAGWYAREEIPDDDSRISIASELKMAFKYGENYRKK